LVILCFLSGLFLTQAQTVTEFTPEDQFLIQESNGSINFLVNGTYSEARQEDNMWVFSDLRLDGFPVTMPLLHVSVQNCNITIWSISRFSSLQNSGTLRYNLTGQGVQVFNFNLQPKEREWSVIFDGEFLSEGKGWHRTEDETIIVTRPASNITIFYMDYPSDVAKNSNIPFHQRHSAAISMGIIVAVVVIVATVIRLKNQKISNEENRR
jgi:hypothetical protein